MKEPFFSVIIPTYNRAHLIKKTLDSVLEQSFRDFEIIVIDNKSTDNTVEVLQPYLTSNNIKLYVQDQNYERSHSRNKGMMLANGKYLTFLDSDDILYSNALQLAYEFAGSQPGIDIFHEHYEIVDTQNQHLYSFSFPKTGTNLLKRLLLGNYLSCIGVFISRSVYTEYRFDENKEALGSEDWDFWIRIMATHSLGVVPKIAAAIIHHDERTVTQNQSGRILSRKNYYLGKYRNTPELYRKLGKYLNIFESGFYLYAATVSYQSENFKSGYRYILTALSKNPSCFGTVVFWKIFLSPIKKTFLK